MMAGLFASCIESAEWREIEALLMHKRHAETLWRVVFHMLYLGEMQDKAGKYRDFFAERTPALLERGVLVVDIP